MNHPRENDLALLAGGETGFVQNLLLERHVRACADCQHKIAQYRELRSELADIDLPEVNWNFLAPEMRANIRLGLEAGACVRATRAPMSWNPLRAVALACLLLLVAAGGFLRSNRSRPAAVDTAGAVLQSTGAGVEIRTGGKSLALLNHDGNASGQTVSAQGEIETRYIDGETGSVTIDNVYLQ